MENYNHNINPETGEVLEDKVVAKKTWSVRLEEGTIDQLDQLAVQQGLDKRELIEHFLNMSKSAIFKQGPARGKADLIKDVETKLESIRSQMLLLLEQSVEAEENARDMVALEIRDMKEENKSLQGKLNDQLTTVKELKEEVKELKVIVQDKETAIKTLTEDHASTKDLNAVYKKQLEEFEVVKEEKKELEAINKELQAVVEELKIQLSSKEVELNTVQTELKATKLDLEKATETINSLKSTHEKELNNKEQLHSLEVEKVKAEVKQNAQDKLVKQLEIVQKLTVKVAQLEAINKDNMQKLLVQEETKKL